MKRWMGKEIIEAPRRGHHARSYKVRDFGRLTGRYTGDPDDMDYEGLTRIPASWKNVVLASGDHKEFTDVLGPLNGYLEHACGRLWNDVYSEIKATLGNSGYALGHIVKEHITVAKHTYRHANGHVYSDDGQRYYSGTQVDYTYGRYSRWDYYVEPETGILRKSIRVPYPVEYKPIESIAIDGESRYALIKGIWYYCKYIEVEDQVFTGIVAGIKHYRYEKRQVDIFKKQLNKKELKKLNKKELKHLFKQKG